MLDCVCFFPERACVRFHSSPRSLHDGGDVRAQFTKNYKQFEELWRGGMAWPVHVCVFAHTARLCPLCSHILMSAHACAHAERVSRTRARSRKDTDLRWSKRARDDDDETTSEMYKQNTYTQTAVSHRSPASGHGTGRERERWPAQVKQRRRCELVVRMFMLWRAHASDSEAKASTLGAQTRSDLH